MRTSTEGTSRRSSPLAEPLRRRFPALENRLRRSGTAEQSRALESIEPVLPRAQDLRIGGELEKGLHARVPDSDHVVEAFLALTHHGPVHRSVLENAAADPLEDALCDLAVARICGPIPVAVQVEHHERPVVGPARDRLELRDPLGRRLYRHQRPAAFASLRSRKAAQISVSVRVASSGEIRGSRPKLLSVARSRAAAALQSKLSERLSVTMEESGTTPVVSGRP